MSAHLIFLQQAFPGVVVPFLQRQSGKFSLGGSGFLMKRFLLSIRIVSLNRVLRHDRSMGFNALIEAVTHTTKSKNDECQTH